MKLKDLSFIINPIIAFRNLNLKKKIAVLFFFVSIVSFLIVSSVFVYSRIKVDKIFFTEYISLLSQEKKEEVELFIDNFETRAIDFSSDGFIRDSLDDYLNSTSTINQNNTVKLLDTHLVNNKLSLDPLMKSILVTDINGNIIGSTLNKIRQENINNTDYFKKTVLAKYGEAKFSGIQYIPFIEAPSDMLVVSAPLTQKESGKPIGVIILFFDSASINKVAQLNNVSLGVHLNLDLEKIDYRFSIYQNQKSIAGNGDNNSHVKLEECNLKGTNTQINGSFFNKNILISQSCLESNWLLESSLIYNPLVVLLSSVNIDLFLAFLLIILLTYLILIIIDRDVIRPLSIITKIVQQVSRGNLSARLPMLKAQDDVNQLFTMFNQMLNNIEKNSNIKSDFVSLVSHQLRTPLTSIRWGVEAMIDGNVGKISVKQKKLLCETQNSVVVLARLVTEFLNLSRVDSGTIASKPILQSVMPIIKETVSLLEFSAKQKSIAIKIIVPKKAIKHKVDGDLLTVVLQNMISNAIKYSPSNSIIKVHIKEIKRQLVIAVQDQGYGIPEEEKNKVFSKFYRGSNIAKKEVQGSGIGLYMVKQIADKTGCIISCDSKIEEGSKFTFTIPSTGMKASKKGKNLEIWRE